VVFSGAGSYGLEANSQFKFRVAGVNEMGTGLWSEWSSLTAAPRGYTLDAPSVLTNFGRDSSVPAVSGEITLSWDAPADDAAAGGEPVANIHYEVWGGASTLAPLTMADETATTHTETVPAGQTWYFQVRAVNSAGRTSTWTSQAALDSAELPGQPALEPLRSVNDGEVVMSWNASDSNGAYIQYYDVAYNSVGGNAFANGQTVQVAGHLTTYTFTGQDAGATRQYWVRGHNSVGDSAADTDTIVVYSSR